MSERIDPTLASRLLSLLDLTSLGEDDSPQRIAELCTAALAAPVLPAAVCFYPEHLANAGRVLAGSGIKLATVVNFPDGGSDPQRVAREIRRALAVGADEIDLVLPYRSVIAGDSATADRVVFGKGRVWQHTVTLLAPAGSDRAKTWEKGKPALLPGEYLVKVFVDNSEKVKKDWKAQLGAEEFVGQVEIQARWSEGYGSMTVADATRVKK